VNSDDKRLLDAYVRLRCPGNVLTISLDAFQAWLAPAETIQAIEAIVDELLITGLLSASVLPLSLYRAWICVLTPRLL
jgi:hypothetical protein